MCQCSIFVNQVVPFELLKTTLKLYRCKYIIVLWYNVVFCLIAFRFYRNREIYELTLYDYIEQTAKFFWTIFAFNEGEFHPNGAVITYIDHSCYYIQYAQ